MRGRTLKLNFAINIFGAVIPLMIALVTVPLYVRQVGDARYGVLSIVWVLLGYFGFLDLGLSRAAVNALARLQSASHQARGRVLVTTLALNLGLGLFGSVCLAVCGDYLLQQVLAIPEWLKPEIARSFPWIVGLFPLALVSGVAIGALESKENFLLANIIQVTGGSLGQIIPVILAVMVSPSLTVVIPAAVLARALTLAAILIAVYINERPLSLNTFDLKLARELLSYGGWISISSVIGPVLSSLDQFVIGSVMNVAAVTHYAVPMSLVTRSQILAGAMSRTLFPRMSSVGATEARDLASRAVLSLSYSYAAVCAPAIIFTPIFFKYWIGAEFAEVAAPVAEILFFGAWINGVAFVPYGLLQSQGRPDLTGKLHAAELLPFTGVLWILTSAFGIKGAALAWSLRCGADAACMLWFAGTQGRSLALALGPPLCLLSASYLMTLYLGPDLWSSAAVGIISGIIGIFLALYFSNDLRVFTRSFFLRLPSPWAARFVYFFSGRARD